jgi:hypothetical protein
MMNIFHIENNVVVAEFKIKENNTEAKIIHSYENAVREGLKPDNNSTDNYNEIKIKTSIIFINDERLKHLNIFINFKKGIIYY